MDINLASEIERQLPADLVSFVSQAGDMAFSQGQNLYLVGGVVRDILLQRENLDIDLVLEGDAIKLNERLAGITQGQSVTHGRFGTVKVKWNKWSIDIATARSETYERPGALPRVEPGSLAADLFRRDFTINAMAIELVPLHWGRLIDLYGGRVDLEQKIIRVLNEKSFIDDATRIWRGIRYEQRLDFQIEPDTLRLLLRDIPMLDTISGDRIRHEIERVLQEERPEKVFHRAGELGVLQKIHSSLQGNGWLAGKFAEASSISSSSPAGLYLALLCYHLTNDEVEQVITYLRFSKQVSQVLMDTSHLKEKVGLLADPELTPSSIYNTLKGYSPMAITVNLLATDSTVVRRNIQTYVTTLRYVKTSLTGDDLIKLGMPPGPQIKEILQRLLEARLDGKVTTRQEEEETVNKWIKDTKKDNSRG